MPKVLNLSKIFSNKLGDIPADYTHFSMGVSWLFLMKMPYANAIQLIIQQQIKRFEKDFNIRYDKAFIQAYDDMNYNISTV